MKLVTLHIANFGGELNGNPWVDFIMILGGICAIMLLLKKVKDEFFPSAAKASEMLITPSPLSVKKADTIATKEDVDEVRDEVDKLWREVHEQRSISREALGKIHKRIDELATKTDTLSGEMKGELTGIKSTLEKLFTMAMTQQNKK